jgi:hypothetical protein
MHIFQKKCHTPMLDFSHRKKKELVRKERKMTIFRTVEQKIAFNENWKKNLEIREAAMAALIEKKKGN